MPTYSRSDAATNLAHGLVAGGLINGDIDAVRQVQKSGNFWYRHSIVTLTTPILASGVSLLLEIGASEPLVITMGKAGKLGPAGQSQATAASQRAPYYSAWQKLGIYNPKEFEGWGGAFKYITDKVLSTKGKIVFELKGVNIQEALAGDANTWVGRYTEWELQQITGNARLFNVTEFFLNGVKQTSGQLKALGITAPIK